MFKIRTLDNGMRARIKELSYSLANTKTISIEGGRFEYFIVPPVSPEGKLKTSRFIFPGGGTDLSNCIEPALLSDRTNILISPPGYGKSSDIPDEILERGYPILYCALMNVEILKALKIKKVILSGHSNASSIILITAIEALRVGIETERIELINPLGLREIPEWITILAFALSGALTKIGGWFFEHPLDLLKGMYTVQKHRSSLRHFFKMAGYEFNKASKARLPEIFIRMGEEGMEVPIVAVLSSWNWGSLHLPLTLSDGDILKKYIPRRLLEIKHIKGLHNVTLGKGSKILAEALEKSLAMIFPLTFVVVNYL